MKTLISYLLGMSMTCMLMAQVEPGAGKWKTWVIPSGSALRLPAPPDDNRHRVAVGKRVHRGSRSGEPDDLPLLGRSCILRVRRWQGVVTDHSAQYVLGVAALDATLWTVQRMGLACAGLWKTRGERPLVSVLKIPPKIRITWDSSSLYKWSTDPNGSYPITIWRLPGARTRKSEPLSSTTSKTYLANNA
jgi:hypothetical protein